MSADVQTANGAAGDISRLNGTPESHIRHRIVTRDFVMSDAAPWHRVHLTRLYRAWDEWQAESFGGEMQSPYLMLLEPASPRTEGDTSSVGGFGGQLQIRLRPSRLRGDGKTTRTGSEYAEGRYRYVADILLHEMIHQWQMEIVGDEEDSYHGHGPIFRDKANEIGRALGLPRVRTSKKRGPDAELPSCVSWPHNVRPFEHYLGAIIQRVPTNGDSGDEDAGEPGDDESPRDDLLAQLCALKPREFAQMMVDALHRRPLTCPNDPNGVGLILVDVAIGLDDDYQTVLLDVVKEMLEFDEDEDEDEDE